MATKPRPPTWINSIIINNYIKDSGKNILTNVIKQNAQGEIQIDMAPINGYFDYLEIVDTNTSQPILFTQVNKDGTSATERGKTPHLYASTQEYLPLCTFC